MPVSRGIRRITGAHRQRHTSRDVNAPPRHDACSIAARSSTSRISSAVSPGVAPSLYISDAAEVERLVAGKKDSSLVLYCNGIHCGKSKRLADDLLTAGFTSVRRYQLGIPVWRALGGVCVIEASALRRLAEDDRTAVFLDAREPQEFAAGTAAGARSLPASRLGPAKDTGEVKAAKDDGRLPMEDHNDELNLIAPLGEAMPSLRRALARCEALGLRSVTKYVPRCMLGEHGATLDNSQPDTIIVETFWNEFPRFACLYEAECEHGDECLGLSHDYVRKFGHAHPLGDDWQGFHGMDARLLTRDFILDVVGKIDARMVLDCVPNGTPKEMARVMKGYVEAGVQAPNFLDYGAMAGLSYAARSAAKVRAAEDELMRLVQD